MSVSEDSTAKELSAAAEKAVLELFKERDENRRLKAEAEYLRRRIEQEDGRLSLA